MLLASLEFELGTFLQSFKFFEMVELQYITCKLLLFQFNFKYIIINPLYYLVNTQSTVIHSEAKGEAAVQDC